MGPAPDDHGAYYQTHPHRGKRERDGDRGVSAYRQADPFERLRLPKTELLVTAGCPGTRGLQECYVQREAARADRQGERDQYTPAESGKQEPAPL